MRNVIYSHPPPVITEGVGKRNTKKTTKHKHTNGLASVQYNGLTADYINIALHSVATAWQGAHTHTHNYFEAGWPV